MAKPDWLIGLRDIGTWELYPWGEKWTLKNDEIQVAIDKIDVIKKLESTQIEILAGLTTMTFCVITMGLGTGIGDGLIRIKRSIVLGNIEIFQSRIQSTNRGSGIVIDIFLSNLDWKRWIPGLESFSNPISNFCSMEAINYLDNK